MIILITGNNTMNLSIFILEARATKSLLLFARDSVRCILILALSSSIAMSLFPPSLRFSRFYPSRQAYPSCPLSHERRQKLLIVQRRSE